MKGKFPPCSTGRMRQKEMRRKPVGFAAHPLILFWLISQPEHIQLRRRRRTTVTAPSAITAVARAATYPISWAESPV